MARLRSARLTDETLVSQIDDYLGELESDLCTIFGFGIDKDVTATAFGLDNSGRLTKQLIEWSRGVALNSTPSSTLGLQSTDTTPNPDAVGYIALIGLDTTQDGSSAGKRGLLLLGAIPALDEYDLDEPFPQLAVDLDSDDFNLWGYLFTSTAQGLCPRGSGNANEYLCSDGVFRVAGTHSTNALVEEPVDFSTGLANTFTPDADEVPLWITEIFDGSGLHAPSDPYLIIVDAGKYLIGASVQVTGGSVTAGPVKVEIFRDRGAVLTQWAGSNAHFANSDGSQIVGVQTEALMDCDAGDKFYVNVRYDNGTGVPYTIESSPSLPARSQFFALRVA